MSDSDRLLSNGKLARYKQDRIEFHYDVKKAKHMLYLMGMVIFLLSLMDADWSVFTSEFWLMLMLWSVLGAILARRVWRRVTSGTPVFYMDKRGISRCFDTEERLISWEEIQRVKPKPERDPKTIHLYLRTTRDPVEFLMKMIDGDGEQVITAMQGFYPDIVVEGRSRE